jgi:hypothetical protein
MILRKWITIFAWILALAWAPVFIANVIADEKQKDYTLTETQTLRLKVKQLEYSSAFEHYQQAVNAFNAEVKSVQKEHDWPETVQFDPNTLTFHEPVRDTPAQGKPPATPTKPESK